VTPDAGRLSTFNARIETIATSRLYREPTRHRRCIILADGFYEWARDETGLKTPYWIHRRDGEPFGFAGLWERWTSRSLDEHVTSCTIVTAPANAFMAPVHDRMPVVLDDERGRAWLTHEPLDEGAALDILMPAENASTWTMDEVSRRVGNVRNDDPSLVPPVIDGSTDVTVSE
jgi:putative SOS response-associated peptidase YedK